MFFWIIFYIIIGLLSAGGIGWLCSFIHAADVRERAEDARMRASVKAEFQRRNK